jgi:hypothetical protein
LLFGAQQPGFCAHTAETHESGHVAWSSATPTVHTECAQLGQVPQSAAHELHVSPSHLPSPHTHAPQS